MLRSASWGIAALSLLVACSSSSDDGNEPKAEPKKDPYAPTVFAPLGDVPTTTSVMIVPRTKIQSYKDGPNAALPDALTDYLARGFGDYDTGPGETYKVRTMSGDAPPAPGANPKRLLRFTHLSDLQIADDESPTRLGQFDSSGSTSSALRPQDAYLCHMTNAAVRTINALSRKDPIAFTLMGGDNADSAQTNELEWVLGMLSGADRVECDSGDDDDLVPGPDNDGKDPFKAEGLSMPWKWVTGNHDVLVQGNFVVDESKSEQVLAADATGGTRFYDHGRAGVVERCEACVVVDERRKLMTRADLMMKVAADKDGHGLGDGEKASGRATYAFDAEGTPFRFVVLDTAHENGADSGVIRQSEIDRVIKPLLDKAKADKKWVILASHHAVTSLTDGGGFGGSSEADALTQEQWAAFVGGYDNVVFSMVGHSHRHRVRPIKPASGHPWWEVMTSAIADWPHQFRLLEIFDQDNGWLMMRATCVDFSTDGDPIAAEARRRGIADLTSGWLPQKDDVTAEDRNVEIWIEKPAP